MTNEAKTDDFIMNLLRQYNIKYCPKGSDIKEIEDALKTASKRCTGKVGFPDITAVVKDFIFIFENKADLTKQVKYTDVNNDTLAEDTDAICNYAENGALYYAKHIVNNTSFKKVFAFGCSGDEKHHIIRPIFIDKIITKLLEPIDNFENFSNENIVRYYEEQCLGIEPKEITEQGNILDKAKALHEDLRNYGNLGETEKPLVVSAILLALCDKKNFIIDSLNANEIKTDGQKIFEAIENYLKITNVRPEDKKEVILNQFRFIKTSTILNTYNEHLHKTPLRYFTEYLNEHVFKAIKENSVEDILGKFYGEFIKYSGGDGKGLGIVLTPEHITELFCDLIELNAHDKVFDPCCGTGGFLVAAMHKMLESATDDISKMKIKQDLLHGIEIRDSMFSIATTNMILRGDGKSNLHCQDFLKTDIKELRKQNYTVGFMNPPYSQAKNKETQHLSELCFIQHLLDSLADNARCVVIVPQSTMIGKTNYDKNIKKEILKFHTLEGVITLNNETFYRIGTNPCIAVFTAHKPHDKDKYCKFINFKDDGFAVNKHVGLVATERAKERKRKLLECWINNADAETKFMVKTKITADDEWLHAFYYFNDEIPKEEDFDKTISDYLTFEFSMIAQGRGYLFEESEE